MHCTNINHQQIQDWAKEFGKSPEYIGGIVSLWQESNNRLDEFPSKLWMEEQLKSSNKENEVSFALKSVDILSSQKADEIFRKGDKNNWSLEKILQELQVPKEQQELIKSLNTRNREEILTNLLANYSYTVEINTTKGLAQKDYDYEEGFRYDGKAYMYDKYTGEYWYDTEDGKSTFITKNDYQKASALASGQTNTQHYSNLTVPGGTNYTEQEISTPLITPSIKGHAQFSTDNGIGWFRSDDKTVDELKGSWIKSEFELPDEFTYGGERYFKQDGEWQTKNKFIEDIETVIWRYNMSLGNERIQNKPDTKTRRILEVQSDLFQKGRDSNILTGKRTDNTLLATTAEEVEKYTKLGYSNLGENDFGETVFATYENTEKNKNQFLQLLNKDNNWVTFFVKSIIQDSAKKGYEKVLFPTGNTASKVEGHSTLEEFKKQKEDRIKELEKNTIPEWKSKIGNINPETYFNMNMFNSKTKEEQQEMIKDEEKKLISEIEAFNREINQLKQELERVEGPEGFGALKPIYNFYENTVTNILNKQFGKIQDYSNIPIKNGIDNLFEENKELSKIGSKQLYSAYLDTIFPDSKVKDIVYHGTNSEFDKFQKDKEIYLALDKSISEGYSQKNPNAGKGKVLSIITNIKNPVESEIDDGTYNVYLEEKNKTFDGVIAKGFQNQILEYIVFEPEQIHILGSKQDIEGFQEFVKESSKPKVPQITDEYGNTWNEIKLTEKNKEKIFLNKSESKVNNSNKYFKDVIQPLIKTLSKKFPNTKVTIISENELPENLKGKNINSYYKNNEVFIIKERVTPEITIEEFLHPFVNVLKESNEELYKSLLKEAKQLFPELRADIKDTYKGVYDNKDDIDKEFLTQVLSKKVSQKQLTLFEQFKEWLKEMLFGKVDNINIENLDIDMKLGDVISLLSDNYTFNINDYSNKEYYSKSNDITDSLNFFQNIGKQNGIKDDTFKENDWSEEVNTLVTQQFEHINTTFEQKRNAEKLMSMSSDLSGTTEKNYILKNNTVLDRASTIIKKDERFKFDSDEFDESKYEDNRIWGNQIDDILRSVIQFRFDENQLENVLSTVEKLRNKRGEESQINEEITQKLIYEFNNFLKQNPTKVAIPQVFLYNEGEKIGGTADLILVDEFGNSEIIDLKSSVNPTKFNGRYFEDYTKVGESGEEYTNRYDKAFQNNRGSKKEKHEAQLSMYAGMLESRAIPLKGTTIFPIHIAETVGDAVTKINVEKQFPLLLNATYLNKTNIDSKHNFRIANTYETEFDQNVNKVVLAIKNEIALLKHIKTENTTYSIKSLERMLKILENRDFVAASRLALYVTDLHKTFLTGDFNLQSKINGLVSEIKGGKITDNRDIIEKLLSYKKKVDHFRPLLNDLTEFYDEVGQDHKDPESIISKLGELSEALKHIDSQYKRTITPFMAENFAQFTDSEEFTKELEKKFDKKQKKIDEYQLELLDINKKTGGAGNNRSKKIEGYISNLKDDIKIGRRTLQTTKEDIINQLKNGMYEDISFAQTWAMAPQDAPNVFVAGASIIIDNNDNELRQHLMELQEEFLPVYKEYARTREGIRNNPKEFNDGLFEIITLGYFDPISKEFIERQELAYVQKTDITKFNKEKKEFQESIKDIEDRNEYWKKLNDWYSLNTKPISANDEVINGVVIKQGYLSVLQDKYKDFENKLISEKQLGDWKHASFKMDEYGKILEVRNDTKEGKELREPNDKYINDKWLALQNGGDIAKLNFYNMLIAQAHKSRQLLPQQLSQEEKYILPYNNKVGLEKSQDGIKKFAKDKWDRAFNEVGSDVKMQYGETTESGLKVIPTMYTSKIALEDVSLDLAQSTLLFAKEALQYEARVKLEPLMTALQIAISTNKPKKTDSKGRLVLKKFAEELNLPGLDAYVDSSESNIEAFFKYYIDHTIYGVSREKSMVNVPILGETDLHSVVDTLSAVIANTSMGLPFGLFSNVANYLQGGAQNIIEANALQFTDKATLAWANKEYASFTDDFVKDVVDPIPETFIGQLIEIIDPFMGEFKDRFGRKISKSQARILMNSSPLMFLQSLSEHNVQLTMMLAMMKNTKLKDEQGLDTNLYDVYKNAWNPETKKIEIKSNILSQLGSTTSNGLLSNTFKNKLSYVLQSTHGNYSKMTAPMANKFWYSRVIKFMRNFFANAVAKRWRGERKNFRIMDITEGYNRTFYRLMREEFKEMVKVGFGFHTSKDGVFNSILGTDTSTLTPRELANLRRNAMDMAFILSTSLIMILLTHMLKNAGDDDEKRRITMLLAPVMRLNAELSAFGQIGNPQKGFMLLPDVGDISRNLSNPTVMYGYIKKTVSFVEQIPKDITNLVVEGDFQRYENNSSYWKKGQSKLFTKGIKLFGASPSKMDLGENIKALNMQQNR